MLVRTMLCLVLCIGWVWAAALDEPENDLEALLIRAQKVLDKSTAKEVKGENSETDINSLIDRANKLFEKSNTKEAKSDFGLVEKELSATLDLDFKSLTDNSEAKEVESDASDIDFKELVDRANKLLDKSTTNGAEPDKEQKSVKKDMVKLASPQRQLELRDALERFINQEEEREVIEQVHKLRQTLEDFEAFRDQTGNHQKRRFCFWCGFIGKPRPAAPTSNCTDRAPCEADSAQDNYSVQS